MSSMATSNWRCVRRCVPLNAICSKKCAAPLLDAASYLLPASIQTPSVTVSHSAGTRSVATLKPFFSVVTSVYSGKAPRTAADDLCLCITRRAWRSMVALSRRLRLVAALLSRRLLSGGNRCSGSDGRRAQRWTQRLMSINNKRRERSVAFPTSDAKSLQEPTLD